MGKFKKDIGKPMSNGEFKKRCKLYQENNPGKTQASFIGRNAIEALLSEKNVSGIWVYYTEKEDGQMVPAFVAGMEDGKIVAGADGKDPSGPIYNDTLNCPPICPEP